ncbi:MAG: PilZ domain-containing protein [Terriglobales bacterium]
MATAFSLGSQMGWNGEWPKQRSASRTLVVVSATVHFQGKNHVGLIRDISRDGLFVYSDFRPKLGENLTIEITEKGGSDRVLCGGTVVRVESKSAGSAIGIALKITSYGV